MRPPPSFRFPPVSWARQQLVRMPLCVKNLRSRSSGLALLSLALILPGAGPASFNPISIRHAIPATMVFPNSTRDIDRLNSEPGAWLFRIDPISKTAIRGWGGIADQSRSLLAQEILAEASAFSQRHSKLLGMTDVELSRVRLHTTGHSWHVTWQQVIQNRRVLDSYLDFTLGRGGQVIGFTSRLIPSAEELIVAASQVLNASQLVDLIQPRLNSNGNLWTLESQHEVFRVVSSTAGYRIHAGYECFLKNSYGGRVRAIVDAVTGDLVALQDLLRTEQLHGTTSGNFHPISFFDQIVSAPFPWIRVQLGPQETDPHTFSDANGVFRFSLDPGIATLHVPLTGLYVKVDNQSVRSPSPLFTSVVQVPGQAPVVFGGAQARIDESTIYFNINRIHDFLRNKFGFNRLDFPLLALTEAIDPATGDPNFPNAYWNGQQFGFGNGGATFWGFGNFADVIFHEYTHAVTDAIYSPIGVLHGPIGIAISEALSDYFAATILDDPIIGENMGRNPLTPPFRRLDNRLVWPEDRDPRDEVHANGNILSAAFWDLRVALSSEVADALVHFAGELFPLTFEAYYEAVLAQDDLLFGDGIIGNGSPHDEAIQIAFGLHGLGPLSARILSIVHQPLGNTDDTDHSRFVTAKLESTYPGIADFLVLLYRPAGTEAFQVVEMSQDAAGTFNGHIPAFSLGTEVQYYLSGARLQPVLNTTMPPDAPSNFLSYFVESDTNPPEIAHTHPATVASFAWPPTIHSRITDAHGIKNAYVEYRINGGAIARAGMVRSLEDFTAFSTTLASARGQEGDVVGYRIVAIDESSAQNETRFPAVGFFQMSVVKDAVYDFDSAGQNWGHHQIVFGKVDVWQLSAFRNHSATGSSSWLCGNATSNYLPGIAAALTTEWYALGSSAEASIWSFMQAQASGLLAHDGGLVQIRTSESLDWQQLFPLGGYPHQIAQTAVTNGLLPGTAVFSGSSTAWQLLSFDLAPFAHMTVQLRFVFASDDFDDAQVLHGWNLDDFTLNPGNENPTDVPLKSPLSRVLLITQPAPNPFNPRVTFELESSKDLQEVSVQILDVRGKMLRQLYQGPFSAGRKRLVWDGRDASGLVSSSGVYYYRISSALGQESGRLVLVR